MNFELIVFSRKNTKNSIFGLPNCFHGLVILVLMFLFPKYFFAESHSRDGGLLRRPHETVRRPQVGARDTARLRLRGLHSHPVSAVVSASHPELMSQP